jgi:hypothetical protein
MPVSADQNPLPDIFYLALEQELAAYPQGLKDYELLASSGTGGVF